MEQKKQIEEMKDIIHSLWDKLNQDAITTDDIVNALYNAGYQKPNKDYIMLSREEYEKLQNENKRLFYQNCNLKIENKNLEENLEIEVLKGKEKAEKILKEILFIKGVEGWQENEQLVEFGNRIVDKIEELAKEFGVEIKE